MIYLLDKQTRDHDRDYHWIFSTREKAEAFMKKHGFDEEGDGENYYQIIEKTLDPESEHQ